MKTKELVFPDGQILKQGSQGHDVKRVQEWLTLNGHRCGIDGEFGPATRAAVNLFRGRKQFPQDGTVNGDLFTLLTLPMQMALQPFFLKAGATLGAGIIEAARAHLSQRAREVGGDNRGPWVRYYCGADGPTYYWCAGFVTRIIRQAAATMGLPCPVNMTLSCDMLAKEAKETDRFIRGKSRLIKPGDIGLVRRVEGDWTHAFLVTKVHEDHVETIEGNSNDEGSRNGFEVCELSLIHI